MKRLILLTAVGLIMAPLCFGYLKTDPPPPFDPNTITFPYDPNQVNYPLFCAVEVWIGEKETRPLDYYDPEGDPVTVTSLQAPECVIITGGHTDWFMIIEPNQTGTFYIDLQWEDIPQRGLPGHAERTMLLNVKENGGPQPWPCGASPSTALRRRMIQTARKQGNVELMDSVAKGHKYVVVQSKADK